MNKNIIRNNYVIYVIIGLFIGGLLSCINYLLFGNISVLSAILGTFYTGIVCFILILILLYIFQNKILYPINILMLFILLFYLSGLINLSSYRGYITVKFWFLLLIISVCGLLIGNLFGFITKKKILYTRSIFINKTNIKIILLVSLISSAFITLKFGLLLVNPQGRFSVPPILQYLVEFSIPALVLLFNFSNNKRKSMLLVLFYILVLFSLGYRNQPMILILCICLSFFISKYGQKRYKSKKSIINISLIASIILVVFSFLYVIRIQTSENLYKFDRMVSYYNVQYPQFTLMLLPLHLQSREAMGVTEVALERESQLKEFINPKQLFFQDIWTLMPGNQISAGNVLGIVVNLNKNVSLTPGLLGGLYISFGIWGILIFFLVLGIIISKVWYKYRITKSPYYLTIVCLITSYTLELINRGLFKPMYILVFIVLRLCIKKVKNNL